MLFGVLGYLLRRFHYPIAPVVVGLILGPMAEKSLRQALQISQGDPMALFHSWIAIILWVAGVNSGAVAALSALSRPKVMQQLGSGDTD